MNIEARVNKIINEGYEFKLEKYISDGFTLFKKEYGMFIGFSVLAGLINGAIGMIPIIGPLAQVVLAGIINMGYFYVARKMKLGERIVFEDFFKPFNSFGNIAAVTLLSGLLMLLGFLLVIPGIYLAVAWTFAVPILYFYSGVGVWDAMEASRRVITKNWWWFFLLLICILFINIAGALCLLVGLFVTIPATHLIMYTAFNDIMKPYEDISDSSDDSLLMEELND